MVMALKLAENSSSGTYECPNCGDVFDADDYSTVKMAVFGRGEAAESVLSALGVSLQYGEAPADDYDEDYEYLLTTEVFLDGSRQLDLARAFAWTDYWDCGGGCRNEGKGPDVVEAEEAADWQCGRCRVVYTGEDYGTSAKEYAVNCCSDKIDDD